jgi:hypothetical protein
MPRGSFFVPPLLKVFRMRPKNASRTILYLKKKKKNGIRPLIDKNLDVNRTLFDHSGHRSQRQKLESLHKN